MSGSDDLTTIERIENRIGRMDFSSKMHRVMYRLSGGRVGGEVREIPVLLLTTTGRLSGKRRTVPLMYLAEENRLLVVASNAAHPDNPPGWWFNLHSQPSAEVQLGSERRPVLARHLDEEERAAVWPQLVNHNPNWGRYQSETTRTLPVVELRLDAGVEPNP